MSDDMISTGTRKTPGGADTAAACMEITVKSHLNRFELCAEPGTQLLAQIQRRFHGGKRLEISDAGKKLTACVHQEQETLIVTKDSGESFSASLEYREDAEGSRIQKSLVRPPMPEKLRFHIPQGELILVQTEQRNFEIYLDRRKVIEMSHMLRRTKKIRILSDMIPKDYYGIVFAMAIFMLHDDDIEIV